MFNFKRIKSQVKYARKDERRNFQQFIGR